MALSVEGKVKCYVCDNEKNLSKLRRTFICPSCICQGDFTSSKGDVAGSSSLLRETFSDKRVKLGYLEEEHRKISERLSKLLEESKQLEAIEQTIADYEVKIDAMQKMINEKKQEQIKSEEYSRKLAKTEKILKSHQEKFKIDIEETHKTIDQVNARMRTVDQERERLLQEIKNLTKESISQLKEFIFPFSVANNCTMIEGPMESCSAESKTDHQTEDEPCDASESFSTTCCQPSMESWANVEPNNQRYNIVESWIPRDSVSRAYCHWSSQMKEHLTKISPADGEVVKTRDNDAYRLSAALAYITQLLTVASHYMDTRFPKKLNFVEFYTKYSEAGNEVLLTDEELLHKVAKLNTNLIYLCLSQNVHPSLLEPTVPGKNLSLLLNPSYSDLGRIGPVYIDSEIHRKVEEALYPDFSLAVDQLNNQEAPQNESYDESEFIEDGWESVQPSTPYMDLYNSQQTTSISSGIMSSIADAVTSFIRKK